MTPLAAWLSAFAFTLVVEAPLYRRALQDTPAAHPWAPWLSVPTHPVVYFVFPALWPGSPLTQTLAAEAFAVLAEGCLLQRLGASRPMAWALVANIASAGLGLVSRALFGWP